MSNTITIKHGAGIPDAGVLAEYELGYVSNEGVLVLGQGVLNPIRLSLPLNEDGSINSSNLVVSSLNTNTKITLTGQINDAEAKVTFGITPPGSNNTNVYMGAIQFLQYPFGSSYCEGYRLPVLSTEELTKNNFYQILTSKGGVFGGDFTFTGALSVDSNSYGTVDPNTAGISGTTGQLYFVIAE